MDRDPRAAYWSQFWQRQKVTPTEALRLAIAEGLQSQGEDPGQVAGDHMMTLAAERGLDTKQHDLYGQALHLASLADIIVTHLRAQDAIWERPADVEVNGFRWVSNAYREPNGVRLRRILIVDRWTPERKDAESHAYFSFGEVSAYQMPMTQTVVIVGQTRDGRHVAPWSKASWNPKWGLRMRKRDGEPFKGNWTSIWREERDDINREHWLEQMEKDRVMPELIFDVEVSVPCKEILVKVGKLIEKKLKLLQEMTETPIPNPSQCDWPIPCPFRPACWMFTQPSEELGFTRIHHLSPPK